MKNFLKLLLAVFVACSWYAVAGEGSESIAWIFFFVTFLALFIQPFKKNNSPIKEQYLKKLKENIKKNQEISEQFLREKGTTYKDFRKKEK